jgi:hypothetical protein
MVRARNGPTVGLLVTVAVVCLVIGVVLAVAIMKGIGR